MDSRATRSWGKGRKDQRTPGRRLGTKDEKMDAELAVQSQDMSEVSSNIPGAVRPAKAVSTSGLQVVGA